MLVYVAWFMVALGMGHTLLGFSRFSGELSAALAEGYWNRFKDNERRTLAFWFVIFGPMLSFLGYMCVLAIQTNQAYQLQSLGAFMFFIGISGAAAFPRSPFWCAVVFGPVFFIASQGLGA